MLPLLIHPLKHGNALLGSQAGRCKNSKQCQLRKYSDGLSQYTEDELRYAVDIVRIDKRIKEIADYTPLNPMTMLKQLAEIERLIKYRNVLVQHTVSIDILSHVEKCLTEEFFVLKYLPSRQETS